MKVIGVWKKLPELSGSVCVALDSSGAGGYQESAPLGVPFERFDKHVVKGPEAVQDGFLSYGVGFAYGFVHRGLGVVGKGMPIAYDDADAHAVGW